MSVFNIKLMSSPYIDIHINYTHTYTILDCVQYIIECDRILHGRGAFQIYIGQIHRPPQTINLHADQIQV